MVARDSNADAFDYMAVALTDLSFDSLKEYMDFIKQETQPTTEAKIKAEEYNSIQRTLPTHMARLQQVEMPCPARYQLLFRNSKKESMDAETLLQKLKDAFNTHDIEAFAACFDENYHSEQPVHPDRTFKGREQVRKNWASNFEEMPGFSAQLIRHTTHHDAIWTEWEWQGTRKDNSKLFMRGVMIMGVNEGKITWGRLYIEPVEVSGQGIEAAVKEVMHGKKGN